MNYLEMKKRAFMSIVNAVKGFIRTISGTPPISLPDCVDNDSLISYSISGNSVQNGEPTPENPVEVESVGDLTTKNVFNYRRYCEEWEAVSPYPKGGVYSPKPDIIYLDEDCFSVVAYNAGLKFMEGEFEENTQYTFKFSVAVYREGYTALSFVPIYVFYTDGTRTAIARSMYPDRFIDIQFTTDANKTVKYMQVPNYAPHARLYFKKTFQIEEGETATEFEPFGKYKISIKMSGKNLFNPEEVIAKFESGDTYMSGVYTCTSFQLKPNTTYYMKTFNPTGGRGFFYMSKNEGVNTGTLQTISVIDTSNHSYPRKYENSATTDDTGLMYIGCYAVGGDAERNRILRENQIQIVEGSYTSATAPDYDSYIEPITINIYLDEPLRKAGDYADYIDFEKQKVVRKIHKWMFKENIVIEYYSDRMPSTQQWTTCCISLGFKNMATGLKNKLTNHFKNSGNGAAHMASLATHGIFSGHSTNDRIYFDLGDSKSIYNADNPITNWEHWEDAYVIGKLETPTETDIVLPKLPTTKGTTIYSIETAVQPSNMSAEYYSTSKGE